MEKKFYVFIDAEKRTLKKQTNKEINRNLFLYQNIIQKDRVSLQSTTIKICWKNAW